MPPLYASPASIALLAVSRRPPRLARWSCMAARQRALPLSTHLVTSRHSLDSNFVCRRPSVTATARNLPLIPPSWLGQRMNARPTQAAQRAGLDSAHHGASTARISTAGYCSPRREHGTHLNGRLLLSRRPAAAAPAAPAAAAEPLYAKPLYATPISRAPLCQAHRLQQRLHALLLLRRELLHDSWYDRGKSRPDRL